MTTTRAPEFRIVGSTEDVTICGLCGRDNLKKTIILRSLDAEGNDVEQAYFGSECAVTVTGKRTRREVILAADVADRKREEERRDARQKLTYYRPEDPIQTNAGRYAESNRRFFENFLAEGKTVQEFMAYVASRIEHWQSVIAD